MAWVNLTAYLFDYMIFCTRFDHYQGNVIYVIFDQACFWNVAVSFTKYSEMNNGHDILERDCFSRVISFFCIGLDRGGGVRRICIHFQLLDVFHAYFFDYFRSFRIPLVTWIIAENHFCRYATFKNACSSQASKVIGLLDTPRSVWINELSLWGLSD